MMCCVRERSRSSSPSQLWVAGPLSPYNVIIYLFCIELLLCSKDMAFDPVPLCIICVRVGPSTPGVYVRPGSWCPRNPGVTTVMYMRTGEFKTHYSVLSVVAMGQWRPSFFWVPLLYSSFFLQVSCNIGCATGHPWAHIMLQQQKE
jgi:hypothetical protein